MNSIYLYDNTFDSLLALISYLITLKIKPQNICSVTNYQNNLIDEPVQLNIINEKEKVKELKCRLTSNILKTIYYIYLSEEENKELIIYYFIINALKYKDEVYYQKYLNCVNKAIKISKYVSGEAHKLKGFLRFKCINNKFYYAEISPSNNVIYILSNHFRKRISNEIWIIKDTIRNIYAIYDLNKVNYYSDKDIVNINLDNTNKDNFEDLWKLFFKTISIKERKNLKVQMNFMPKRYWKNMLEMSDYNERNS